MATQLVPVKLIPPEESYSSFVCSLAGIPENDSLNKQEVVDALRQELQRRICRVVTNGLMIEAEGWRKQVKVWREEGELEGKVNEEDEEDEEREEVRLLEKIQKTQWDSYNRMQKEVQDFAAEIFPYDCIHRVKWYRDWTGKPAFEITWLDMNPDLIFTVLDKERKRYWDMIRERELKCESTFECWEYCLKNISIGEAGWTIEQKLNNNKEYKRKGLEPNLILGNFIDVKGHLCKFGPPTSKFDFMKEEEPVVCGFCYKMNHIKRKCTKRLEILKRKVMEKKKKKFKMWEKERERRCGQRRRSPLPKPTWQR